jgi:hypothetical protein
MARSEFDRLDFGFEVKRSTIIIGGPASDEEGGGLKLLISLLFCSPIFRHFIFGSISYETSPELMDAGLAIDINGSYRGPYRRSL